jgi:hypothetical protein
VTASHVLFNFTGTSGNVLQTSSGNVLYGTFLATDGGQFQFSELDLTGALINTDGNVQLVSGQETLTFEPFAPTPLPAAFLLFATGLGAMGLLGWRSDALSAEPFVVRHNQHRRAIPLAGNRRRRVSARSVNWWILLRKYTL